jgi:hypothetical protein
MERIAAGALAGAIAGVVYFAMEMVAAKWIPRWRKHARMVALGVTAFVWSGLHVASLDEKLIRAVMAPFKTQQARMLGELTDELGAVPGFERAFRGLSGDEAEAKGRELASRGLRRLDDRSLLSRAELMNILLPRLSESTCACMARGAAVREAQAEIANEVQSLERHAYANWLEISKQAMIAELQENPIRVVAQSEIEKSLGTLESRLSPEDAERLGRGIAKGASDVDACWAMRTLYRVAIDLPAADRAVVLRALVSE